MRHFRREMALFACLGLTTLAHAQGRIESSLGFDKARPIIGEKLPELTVLDSTGQTINLRTLRGSYSVITFGCLT